MITTIINYCTNDFRFLDLCLKEARKFSHEIIVPVCDHFFDGTPENRHLLNHSYAAHPDVKFVEFAYGDKAYGIYPRVQKGDADWIHYWHSTARYVGYHFATHDKVLFLDVDEVADGEKMRAWLNEFPHDEYAAVRFTNYFYFREARFRANKIMRNGLLVKKEALAPELLLDIDERMGTFYGIEGAKLEGAPALDGEPLFHHYSWVKTKEEMRRKVVSWGHHGDKDWPTLIETEFARPFAGRDAFWGFEYAEVEPFANPLAVEIPTEFLGGEFSNWLAVNQRSIGQFGL